ncbi:MAG: hypothetical protein K6E96_04735 [Bacteroidales bacterium]|jgi:hypothetical protein|nr:hypothetical protein [Bacteroidales bacterium]
MKHALLVIATLILASSATAEVGSDDKPPSPGLSVFANAGGFWADKVTANFYSGRPENANTIYRVLHSDTYGHEIWLHLVDQQAISPSTIGDESQLQVVEYPEMYYRLSYQIGLGLHYEYASGFGWLLRFDLARLNAIGAFNLSSNNGTGILGHDPYIRCGMLGKEDRISIDLAITRKVAINETLDLEIDLGASLINTKVKDNLMEIGGGTWSILDVWNGQTPHYGVGNYEYINQGGVGYGVFISLLVGYSVPSVGSIKAGYTCYQARTVLEGYTAWGWQHMLGMRIEMNNFSFIN